MRPLLCTLGAQSRRSQLLSAHFNNHRPPLDARRPPATLVDVTAVRPSPGSDGRVFRLKIFARFETSRLGRVPNRFQGWGVSPGVRHPAGIVESRRRVMRRRRQPCGTPLVLCVREMVCHKAAIYDRVSTLDQEPENQLQELRRYVAARGS